MVSLNVAVKSIMSTDIMLRLIVQNFILQSVIYCSKKVHNAECRHGEHHYAERRHAERHCAERRYAKCRYVERRYAECRGAVIVVVVVVASFKSAFR